MTSPDGIWVGTLVRTHPTLESTKGMTIHDRHLNARKPNMDGTIQGYVPGHGGDVWWVSHENGDIAAYCYSEFELRRNEK